MSNIINTLMKEVINQRKSDSNRVFIQNLYRGILGRMPLNGEINNWINAF